MKAFGAAIAAGVILLSGTLLSTDVSAQSIRIGPGGVRITTDRDRWDRRDRWERRDRWDRRDTWDRRDRCRTIIERRRDRFGDWVTVRRRVCRW